MLWSAALLLAVALDTSRGHGSLNEPPSRASAWRHGYPTPPDYDDDGCYCGGYGVQWELNGGLCGVCGDAWHLPVPRPHELGGLYGTGAVLRTYTTGDLVPVTVNLTTSHKGRWLLKLCPDARDDSQDCFDEFVLPQSNGETEFRPDVSRVYELEYRLPDGVSCERCVIQWAYTAGNNWGTCEDGSAALGCGPQENFRACADVAIQPKSRVAFYNANPMNLPYKLLDYNKITDKSQSNKKNAIKAAVKTFSANLDEGLSADQLDDNIEEELEEITNELDINPSLK